MRIGSLWSVAWPAGFFALLYFAGAELGHWLTIEPGHFATFWPPAGIYLAVLLRSDLRRWPLFFLAAGVANFTSDVLLHDKTPLVSLGFTLANSLEAFAGVWLVRRLIGSAFTLHRLRDVLGFTTVTALGSTVLGASAGAIVAVSAFDAPLLTTWQVWWIADLVGVLVLAPVIWTVWDRVQSGEGSVDPIGVVEGAALAMALAVVTQIVFGAGEPVIAFPYFLLPLLIWSALRFGVAGASLSVFLIALLSVRHTVDGKGPFADPVFEPSQRVLLVQAFLSLSAICSLVLAAITQERREAAGALAKINAELEQRVELRTAELARANEELSESQRRLSTLLGHLPGMAYRCPTQEPWPLTVVSDGVMSLTGRSAQDFAQGLVSWAEIMHPDDVPRVAQEVEAALQQNRIFSLAYRILHSTGEVRWVLDRGQPVYAADGTPVAFEGFVGDLTEQKRIEEELRESEARLRATFDQAAVGVAHVGMDNRTLWVNPGLCAMLGYTEAELREKTFVEITHPDDLAADLALARKLVAGELPSYRIEKRYLHKDGSIVSGDLAVSLVRDSVGRPKYAVGVVVDISERKQIEARLEAVLASINDHLVCYDRQMRYTFVNDRAAQILGKSKEELLGRALSEVFPGAVGNQYFQELERALAEQRVIRSEHYYAPFGKWFENHIYPSPEGLTVFSADVTWRKGMEQELRYRAEQLSEADQRKDEFLATLAHELRNPLAPIRNALEVIGLAGDNRGLVQQARRMMERQVAQMVRLIDDLLDVSRITQNKLELRKEWVELAVAVQNAVETARPLIEAARHQFAVTLPDQPILLHADLTRLAQVFSNLLTNAAKYTEPGGSIALNADCRDGELLVQVRDSGVGIPPDKLPRIFDLFVQVDHSLERSHGGLGIGLTLVKRLVEMHGGSIEARSEYPGGGSEFTVRLPLPARSPVVMSSGVSPLDTSSSIRARILVVDDNRDSAESLALMLRLRGAEVRTAHDGYEAIEVAAQLQPSLILLDIGMPKLNGYETARRIREQSWCNGTPLVAMTGWGQQEDKRRAIEAGFDHHMTKPVDFAALEKILATLSASPVP